MLLYSLISLFRTYYPSKLVINVIHTYLYCRASHTGDGIRVLSVLSAFVVGVVVRAKNTFLNI